MSTYQAIPLIRLMPMPQLAEALDRDDDWTGLTDAAVRRRRQNRLNVRAHRRRKAAILQAHPTALSTAKAYNGRTETGIPCWLEDQQTVSLLPASLAKELNSTRSPLIPSKSSILNPTLLDRTLPARIIFPLAPDHLITLLQYNVLRACLTNRRLVSRLLGTFTLNECSSAALHVLPSLPDPSVIPPSLHPTALQRIVPHEGWVDIIPHPVWRDNIITALGRFDEDELWSDTIGGLFEGFPDSEVERRGVIAWSPPWHVSGWEISEGFWRKWGWTLKGCEDVLEATNRWRKERGEEPLAFGAWSVDMEKESGL